MKRYRAAASLLSLVLVACSAGPTADLSGSSEITIEGVVHNSLGQVIAGAEVRLLGTDISTVTDDAGRFRFEGVRSRELTVVATASGYATTTEELTVGDSAEAFSVVVVLRSVSVVGVRLTRDGTIVPEAPVSLVQPAGGLVVEEMTNAGGTVRFEDIPPGKYQVRAESGSEETRIDLEFDAGESPTVELALPVAEASALIVDHERARSVFACVFTDEPLGYTVRLANEGNEEIEEVVIEDTLDGPFGRSLRSSDVEIGAAFPEATVDLGPDGQSFRISLGGVSPGGPGPAYTVRLPPSTTHGIWCNEARATGRVAGMDTAARDERCITTTLVIQVDRESEDGVIGADGRFDGAKEMFAVGDGGTGAPQAFVYRVTVLNNECEPLSDLHVKGTLVEDGGEAHFRGPVAGSPSMGSVTRTEDTLFEWSIGSLPPGERAELLIRAEARSPGRVVQRVEAVTPVIPGPLIFEEATEITP